MSLNLSVDSRIQFDFRVCTPINMRFDPTIQKEETHLIDSHQPWLYDIGLFFGQKEIKIISNGRPKPPIGVPGRNSPSSSHSAHGHGDDSESEEDVKPPPLVKHEADDAAEWPDTGEAKRVVTIMFDSDEDHW